MFDTSNYRKPHAFDPVHDGADECECGLTSDAGIHVTTTKPQSTTEPPDSIWLPADTDADAWNILAKNPSRDWSTGKPANNIEYRRVSPASAAPVVDNERVEEIRRWRERFTSYHSDHTVALNRAFGYIDYLLERVGAAATAAPVEPSIYHCSCGAACTADEYAAHRAMGHDEGAR